MSEYYLPKNALGIMSGTSMDGLDLAILRSDGDRIIEPLQSKAYDFPSQLRQSLLSCQGKDRSDSMVRNCELVYSEFVADRIGDFLSSVPKEDYPDYIGFHGQTIAHDASRGISIQLGDANMLHDVLGIPVIYDFRRADIEAGGEGAPLAPCYHRAIAWRCGLSLPLAFVNVGGIANITYCCDGDLVAFDCGVGNVLMDDEVRLSGGMDYDSGGDLARRGVVSMDLVEGWLGLSYFSRSYPKSLHREDFHGVLGDLSGLSLVDRLASLVEFTVLGIVRSFDLLPSLPLSLVVCGGGRRNDFLCERLGYYLGGLGIGLVVVDDIGFDGDMLEAQAFGYLALRCVRGFASSWVGTTGVGVGVCAGVLVGD